VPFYQGGLLAQAAFEDSQRGTYKNIQKHSAKFIMSQVLGKKQREESAPTTPCLFEGKNNTY